MATVFKGFNGFLTGIGVVLAAPIVSPVLGKVARPLAKAAIKTYLSAAESFESAAEEARKEWSALVAEAKAERSKASACAPEATPFPPV
jgi:uncharacterized protein DUF5132